MFLIPREVLLPSAAMKSLLRLSAVSLLVLGFGASCERHPWEDTETQKGTKRLFQPHGGGHAEKDEHASEADHVSDAGHDGAAE